MASQVEIANFAIIQLGGNPISSLTEDTNEAKVIKAIWDQSRRELLRTNSWNFAIKRQLLAQSVTPPGYDFSYRYALPSDLIRTIQVYNDSDYKIEGRFVITNSQSCSLKYVADIKDVNEWSSDFCSLMSMKLAADIAYAITKNETLAKSMYQAYTIKLTETRFADASEDIPDDFQFPNTLLSERG